MSTARDAQRHLEDVEIRGHIIDSLILPKVLDLITSRGGSFRIKEISVGHDRRDPSHAVIEISAPTEDILANLLAEVADHGAVSTTAHDCRLTAADMAGAFPDGFYSTTNQRTEIRLDGHWLPVADQEMDCGIVVDTAKKAARCVPMIDIRLGDQVLVGHAGVRVLPEERAAERKMFEFMGSAVSTEKPKGLAVREIARELAQVRRSHGRALLVGGPAIAHTGSTEHVCHLIREGYLHVLFAGNALATHDIEQAFYGTSLGIHMERGIPTEEGHEHHLRSINRIRRLGGIRQAVESGALRSGIMYECVRHNIDFLLAGSIRDDGPLPEVITDALVAQREMRRLLQGVGFCLMVATTLHSIAVGNLLPAWVKVACVDINPSTVIKLNDRGSFQTVGLVTDVEPFMRSLVAELKQMEG